MKIVKIFLMAILIAGHAWADSVPDNAHYIMEAGDVRSLEITDIDRVAVGNPDIVAYKVLDNGQLLIIAQKTGLTALQIWRKGDRLLHLHFEVRESGTLLRIREARQMVKDIRGVSVDEVGGRVLFEGKVSKDDSAIIERIAQSISGAISMVKVEEFTYLPLLRVDVRIVEISRKTSSQLGIRWDSTAGGPVVGISTAMAANPLYSITSSQETRIPAALGILQGTPLPPAGDSNFYGYAGITGSLGSQIDVMAQTGEARLLAAPKLVAKSGEEADFLSGGEFPTQTIDELGRPAISFQEYGIQLHIRPLVDSQQRISTSISAKVSSLDFSVAVNGVPGLLSRKVDSVVNVNNNDTIVISGLTSSQNSRQVSKIPVLGDLPIIGGLFRSTGKADQKTELVILLTPRIVAPGDQHDLPLQVIGNNMTREGFEKSNLNSVLME